MHSMKKTNSFANNHRKSSVYIIFKLYLIYSTQLVFFPCKRKLTCHATPQQPLICKEQ